MSTKNLELRPLAFIGFGEAAAAFCAGFRTEQPDLVISAFDIKTQSPSESVRQNKRSDFENAAVRGAETLASAFANAAIVFSTVTADQALMAATDAATCITPGTLFLDCNSCAPGTKRQSAARIAQAGGKYVDVAVMSPVHPLRHKTPVLIAGEHANTALLVLQSLGMDATPVSGPVGAAAAIKMTRSIFVKGLEALLAECVLTGRQAGVDEFVLQSLDASYPGFNWRKQAAYALERVLTHGIRRAAEMREVANTVRETGLTPNMSAAAVEWQQRLGDLHLSARDIGKDDYQKLADAVLVAINGSNSKFGQ